MRENAYGNACIPTVAEARAAANAWLIDHLPDRFAAGIPARSSTRGLNSGLARLSRPAWAGRRTVRGCGREEVQAHTPLAQMQTQALHLYNQHRAAIDTALS